MLKRRLIPVLFLKNGLMVRSEGFSIHQVIGHPLSHVERLSDWDADELIILDISGDPETFEINRDDNKFKGPGGLLEFVTNTASTCAVPLTLGGHIVTVIIQLIRLTRRTAVRRCSAKFSRR